MKNKEEIENFLDNMNDNQKEFMMDTIDKLTEILSKQGIKEFEILKLHKEISNNIDLLIESFLENNFKNMNYIKILCNFLEQINLLVNDFIKENNIKK